MPAIYSKAPGKIILFGEHAVVYGQPAIAIPVTQVHATARVFPILNGRPGDIRIQAPDIHLDSALSDLPKDDPIATAVQLSLETIGLNSPPAFKLQVTSTIPIAAGMGSSAAISIVVIRAVSDFFGRHLQTDDVSQLTYQVEKIQHGVPSGIDNSVIAYQKAVCFTRDKPIEFFDITGSTHWIIADTGEKTPTRVTVGDVRNRYEEERETYQDYFNRIGAITQKAKQGLIKGDKERLGNLMDENQHWLAQIGVSSQNIEHLIEAAREAGALGAKLSGGGRGGNIIALSPSGEIETITAALLEAGAKRVIKTILTQGEGA